MPFISKVHLANGEHSSWLDHSYPIRRFCPVSSSSSFAKFSCEMGIFPGLFAFLFVVYFVHNSSVLMGKNEEEVGTKSEKWHKEQLKAATWVTATVKWLIKKKCSVFTCRLWFTLISTSPSLNEQRIPVDHGWSFKDRKGWDGTTRLFTTSDKMSNKRKSAGMFVLQEGFNVT